MNNQVERICKFLDAHSTPYQVDGEDVIIELVMNVGPSEFVRVDTVKQAAHAIGY